MAQIILNGLINSAIIVLVASGFTLIYGTCRFFHLAHGAVYVAGAYLLYLFFHCGVPLGLSLLLASLVCCFIGISMERFVYRPLREKNASGLIYLMASLGLLISIQSLFALFFGNANLTIWAFPDVQAGHEILGARITSAQTWIMIWAFIMVSALFTFRTTPLGQTLQAVSDNAELAEALGVDLKKIFLVTLGAGSLLGGAAGGLISLQGVISPFMGFTAILYGLLACIIGGLGSILGTLLGSLLLGMVNSIGVMLLAPEWKDTMALAVLMLVLAFRPHGILGTRS